MDSEVSKVIGLLEKNLILNSSEIEELAGNFEEYREEIESLLKELGKYNEAAEELSRLNSRSARLNYENYETYMAVHTNSIKISGSRSALKIAGQKLSRDIQNEIQDILDKYLMIKF